MRQHTDHSAAVAPAVSRAGPIADVAPPVMQWHEGAIPDAGREPAVRSILSIARRRSAVRLVILAVLCLAILAGPAAALPPNSTSLTSLAISANTGEKPQSKVWTYDGKWWCVLPTSSGTAGTWIWRLDGSTWTRVLQLSTSTGVKADVKSVGPVVHVLLYNGVSSALASAEYVPLSQTYQAWSTRPANVPITLDTGVETATIDVDSQGRMWLASDVVTDIVVRYSDSPYSSWSAPVNLANNVNSDDISAVTAMPGNKIGVLWSNQATKRFGFRTHLDGTDPTLWTPDEVPASQSAIDNVGAGMADDHLNVAVASDGTLYAAVKTGYDTAGYPKIAFLVRRPAGTWDNLYGVDEAGSRGICLLDEAAGTVAVVYMSVEGSGNIIYKETPISSIAFGSTRNTLISGSLAEPTSTKQNIAGSVVVLATSGSNAVGVLRYGSDVTAPTVGLTSPNGGESWVIGSIHNILWTATDDVGVTGVDLEYSTNGGSGWSAIASGLANTGSYAWTVPGPATTQARVRVTARDAAGHSAQAASAANFEIRAVATFTITASAGAGGSISPSGSVPVVEGGSQPFTIAPDGTHHIGDVLVDGVSQGPIGAYLFSNVTADHTIAASFVPDGGPADLAGWWPLDEGSGTVAHDLSGLGNDGAVVGSPLWVPAVKNLGLKLNGTNQYALVPTDPTLDLTDAITLSTWIKPEAYTGTPQDLIKKGNNGGTNGYELTLSSTGSTWPQKVFLRFNQVTSGDTYRINSTTLYPYDGNTWLHVAGTYDGAMMRLYINGVEEASKAMAVPIATNTDPLGIGVQSNVQRFFKGTMDDVRVYGRALSAAEILALASHTITASAGSGGSISPSGAVLVAHTASQGFTIAADPGYSIADVLVDGVSVGAVASYTFSNVTADHTIAASFTGSTFTITASAGSGGTIAPSGSVSVPSGGEKTFTIAPDGCHTIAGVLVDGVSVGAVGSYTFSNVTANHTIAASFALKTYTIAASAGAGGSITPGGNVSVACGGEQAFAIAPDGCHTIADVLVDGVSVGAVASYTFSGVTADHTIAASFALKTYTIAASDGAGGGISPSGDVTVSCGGEQVFAITADDCYAIADVLVDGVSVGAVASYTFSNVTANHNIAASFVLKTYTIVASAGAGGGISPSGNVTVDCGGEQSFAIAANVGFVISQVLVDGIPAGPVASYTFTTVTENHTIAAAFVQVGPSLDVIAPVPPPGAVISTGTPCVAVPVVFTRSDATPLMGYSVTLELSSNLSLCGVQFASAGYTHAPRQFAVTPLAGNRWTVDDVTLGSSCGATGSGAIFLVHVTSSEPTGTGTLTVVSALARDCTNRPIPADPGPAATIPIDNLGPVRTLDLTALQSKSGNYLPPPGGPHERTAIQLTFAVPPDAATVEVYRKEFGGYPQYDENGGAAPAMPAALPAPGWVRTEVTASGQTDEPPVRDYWYYALVTKDAYSNRSAVSNMTGGTLDYHLGDVHDGTAECAGDDQVTMTDVSFLHAHYGATVPVNDALECLDVGATLDMSTNLRPTTDNVIEFEDLMMFALNYGGVSAPQPPLRDESLASGGIDRVTLGMPPTVSPGEVFDVYMTLEPGGVLQGLSVKLAWDAAVAEPLSTTPGSIFEAEGGVTWSPGMTTVDGALLGVRSQGLLQNGTFGVVQFRALAAGDPQVHVASFRARDRFNAPLPLELAVTGADPQLPLRTELALAKPTPFAGSTTLEYSLAVRGQAELVVFGVDGRRVRTLQHGMQEPGVYRFSWDGADDHGRAVPAGVYFVRLSTGGDRFTRTLVRLGH